jgi:hypothetical protein
MHTNATSKLAFPHHNGKRYLNRSTIFPQGIIKNMEETKEYDNLSNLTHLIART